MSQLCKKKKNKKKPREASSSIWAFFEKVEQYFAVACDLWQINVLQVPEKELGLNYAAQCVFDLTTVAGLQDKSEERKS